jgi:phospholipid transport system substrate-binding protein
VQLLRDTFADRITEHSDEQVVFLGELRKNAFAEVRAQMNGRKIDTPVDFRLIHRAHEWRVYDVVIDGASIVSNYRSQFNSIIRDVSYVGLVKKMRQKAIAVKVFERFPSPQSSFGHPSYSSLTVMWQNAGAPNWREHVVSVKQETCN